MARNLRNASTSPTVHVLSVINIVIAAVLVKESDGVQPTSQKTVDARNGRHIMHVQHDDVLAVDWYFSAPEVSERGHGEEQLEFAHARARLSAQSDEFLLAVVEGCTRELFERGLEGGMHVACHDPHKISVGFTCRLFEDVIEVLDHGHGDDSLEGGHHVAPFLHIIRDHLLDRSSYGKDSKLVDGLDGCGVQVVDDLDDDLLLELLQGLHLFLLLFLHLATLLSPGHDGGGGDRGGGCLLLRGGGKGRHDVARVCVIVWWWLRV
eukprot:6212993-Pleurochrysis_carterae.AAC.2